MDHDLVAAIRILPISTRNWSLCLGLVAATLLGQLLMNQGFAHCRSWKGGVFMSSEVVLTVAAEILLFVDPVSLRFWLGTLFVLGGTVAINLETVLRQPTRRSDRGSIRLERLQCPSGCISDPAHPEQGVVSLIVSTGQLLSGDGLFHSPPMPTPKFPE